MNYKEATYTEKQAFEKTLTISQRAKLRRMEKEHKEQIQPINWARCAREEEVRREAYVTLKIAERVKELEETSAPRIYELREQLKAIEKELLQLLQEQGEAKSKIQTEPYRVASDDPQVKAMVSIWRKTKEAQEAKIQELVDSFKGKVTV